MEREGGKCLWLNSWWGQWLLLLSPMSAHDYYLFQAYNDKHFLSFTPLFPLVLYFDVGVMTETKIASVLHIIPFLCGMVINWPDGVVVHKVDHRPKHGWFEPHIHVVLAPTDGIGSVAQQFANCTMQFANVHFANKPFAIETPLVEVCRSPSESIVSETNSHVYLSISEICTVS